MKSRLGRNSIYYVLVVGTCLALIWLLYQRGVAMESRLHPDKENVEAAAFTFGQLGNDLVHHIQLSLPILLLQIIVIIAISRLFAYLFNKMRQPAVIGEIIAGILLGPSLLGYFFPEVSAFLFPTGSPATAISPGSPDSVKSLQLFSQIGLVLFMFIIGMELDITVLRKKITSAVVVSHNSIFLSFLLGMGLAYFLYDEYAGEGISFKSFSLFMGISMSITAFPVLARIIQERGWIKTPLGSFIITCAAIDDITAWCLLALVITLIKAGVAHSALFTIGMAITYLAVMLLLVRPFLRKIGNIYISKENLNRNVMGFIFLVLFISAFLTEVIGIHALVGAFVAGLCMPQNLRFKKVLSEKFEDVSLVLLLPLFFVCTGLRTEIGLLNSWHHWLIAGLVILVATVGKFMGSGIAAKFTGQGWRESLIIGVLMNTRGLMELVVLNIGYDLGILSAEIFTILVIMALYTTFMAGPIIQFIEFVFKKFKQPSAFQEETDGYRILLSFGPPRMGATLMKLAEKLVYREKTDTQVSALHLTNDPEVSPQEALTFEKEGFRPIRKTASDLSVKLNAIYKLTDDIDNEIIRTCNQGQYDMLLLGGARSLFTENIVGGKVGHVMHNVHCNVGILIDKGINDIHKVLVFYTGEEDVLLKSTVYRFTDDPAVEVHIINISENASVPWNARPNIHWVAHRRIEKDFLDTFDLLLIGYDYWTNLARVKTHWLNFSPSVLILRNNNPA